MTRLVHVQDSLPDSARLSHKNFRAKFLHFAYSNANAEVRVVQYLIPYIHTNKLKTVKGLVAKN